MDSSTSFQFTVVSSHFQFTEVIILVFTFNLLWFVFTFNLLFIFAPLISFRRNHIVIVHNIDAIYLDNIYLSKNETYTGVTWSVVIPGPGQRECWLLVIEFLYINAQSKPSYVCYNINLYNINHTHINLIMKIF